VSVLRRESGRFRANSPIAHELTLVSENGGKSRQRFAQSSAGLLACSTFPKSNRFQRSRPAVFVRLICGGLALVINQILDKGLSQRAPPLHSDYYRDAAQRSILLTLMRKRLYPVLVETYHGRSPTGLSAPATAQPVEVALALREKGWVPYRIRFEPEEDVWIAKVIDWGQAA
jgi:hypothetical protein